MSAVVCERRSEQDEVVGFTHEFSSNDRSAISMRSGSPASKWQPEFGKAIDALQRFPDPKGAIVRYPLRYHLPSCLVVDVFAG
jgi:hypothetical protein